MSCLFLFSFCKEKTFFSADYSFESMAGSEKCRNAEMHRVHLSVSLCTTFIDQLCLFFCQKAVPHTESPAAIERSRHAPIRLEPYLAKDKTKKVRSKYCNRMCLDALMRPVGFAPIWLSIHSGCPTNETLLSPQYEPIRGNGKKDRLL